jgi:hypothetical protein
MFDVYSRGDTVRIIAALENIDAPMLTRVWQELEYRINVCRVTRGVQIEHLWLSKRTFSVFLWLRTFQFR